MCMVTTVPFIESTEYAIVQCSSRMKGPRPWKEIFLKSYSVRGHLHCVSESSDLIVDSIILM